MLRFASLRIPTNDNVCTKAKRVHFRRFEFIPKTQRVSGNGNRKNKENKYFLSFYFHQKVEMKNKYFIFSTNNGKTSRAMVFDGWCCGLGSLQYVPTNNTHGPNQVSID
jgi:hypothetical protein